MEWLSFWLKRGISVSKTWRFGEKGEPKDPALKKCLDCGVERKDHGEQPHLFREIE